MNATNEQGGSGNRRKMGLSWDHPSKSTLMSVALALALATSLLPLRGPAADAGSQLTGGGDSRLATMIVRELPGSGDSPERAVARLGGEVGRHIGILDGFVAQVPQEALAALAQVPGLAAISPDARVHLLDDDDDRYDAGDDRGSMTRWRSESPAPTSTGTTATPAEASTWP